ncbi:MAG: nucleotide-binding protein [candidate division Zixibacteria bacterium]|nr:nucleotide-binding protein [candidate division Zixibacteria bacterium]
MKKCFLIAPIGQEKSEVRRRTEVLWARVILPACEELEYEALRADLIAAPGNISQDIIYLLTNSELVIADITGSNPNVMYELGVRHTAGKPVVVLAQKDEHVPFDIASYRILYYSIDSPPDWLEAKTSLITWVGTIQEFGEWASPVRDVFESEVRKAIEAESGAAASESLGPLLRSVSERMRLLESQIETIASQMPRKSGEPEFTRDVFIVHGHDGALKNELARFLERLDFNPIILHERADRGQAILQKLQYESTRVGYAFILHTPDDEGRVRGTKDGPFPRSRQNVVFEHGMFVGKFSHQRVCAIVREGVEIPSDLSGIIYKRVLGDGGIDSIALQLIQELRAAGYVIDANKLG